MAALRARILAFYLPQFHPTRENDEWWGKGFTEWTNVSKARPLFEGHYQPRLPANLGYYDLRVPEVREAQAAMAGSHGIEGFCYWHYWFQGKRLLARPFDEVLTSGRPDYPFCLAWVNQAWTRRWMGEGDILQAQQYSPEDDLRHIRWLAQAFGDRRYVRVCGRPLFLIYRPADLPSPQRTTERFRAECVRLGLPEPFLLGMNGYRDMDYRTVGFDGTLSNEPQLRVLQEMSPLPVRAYDGQVGVYDYVNARERMMGVERSFPVYRSIFVSWDNTPRRGVKGVVFLNSGPERFRAGLSELVQMVADRPEEDRLVFINAWNEWAEGNYLEPDKRNGLNYLEAVKSVNLARSGQAFGTRGHAG
jgi:lipopolysaccharide biosynthesis protein